MAEGWTVQSWMGLGWMGHGSMAKGWMGQGSTGQGWMGQVGMVGMRLDKVVLKLQGLGLFSFGSSCFQGVRHLSNLEIFNVGVCM